MKDYIVVAQDRDSLLYHGLFYTNKPTPSGCNRPTLQLETLQGLPTAKEALEGILKHFSTEQLLNIEIPKVIGNSVCY